MKNKLKFDCGSNINVGKKNGSKNIICCHYYISINFVDSIFYRLHHQVQYRELRFLYLLINHNS